MRNRNSCRRLVEKQIITFEILEWRVPINHAKPLLPYLQVLRFYQVTGKYPSINEKKMPVTRLRIPNNRL